MMQYVQDYDDKYPLAQTDANVSFAEALDTYVKSKQVYYCPSATPDDLWTWNGWKGDYGMNEDFTAFPPEPSIKLSSVIKTAETVLFADANGYELGNTPDERHFDGSNYAYVDGHVKWHSEIPDSCNFNVEGC